MPPVFAILLVLGFVFSGRVNYVYSHNSVDSIRHNENQIAYQRIEELFGIDNQMAIIVPAGDYGREAKLISEVEELSRTVSITGLANIKATDEYYLTSELTPRQFAELADLDYEVAQVLYTGYAMDINEYGQVVTNLENYAVPLLDMFCYLCDKRDEVEVNIPADTEERLDELEQQINDAKLQLKSDNWSRIVLYADIPTEGEESYNYLEIIHGITARYYDEAYVVGDTTSCKDLRTSFEKDNLLISVLSIVFVISVLLFTFKSAGLPVLLILVIQGSIWINFSIPYLAGNNLFFLTYLIISAIQMGANIDYAIVISSRFMELRESHAAEEGHRRVDEPRLPDHRHLGHDARLGGTHHRPCHLGRDGLRHRRVPRHGHRDIHHARTVRPAADTPAGRHSDSQNQVHHIPRRGSNHAHGHNPHQRPRAGDAGRHRGRGDTRRFQGYAQRGHRHGQR